MTDKPIAQWAIDEANRRCGYPEGAIPTSSIRQLAIMIERHEQPPVAPELLAAREWYANGYSNGALDTANTRAGRWIGQAPSKASSLVSHGHGRTTMTDGVTQADRDAAKECCPIYAGMLNDYGEKTEQESWDNYWKGKYDHLRHVQHFARLRQQAIAQHEGGRGEPVALLQEHPSGERELELYRNGSGCLTDTDKAAGWSETPLYPPATRAALNEQPGGEGDHA